MVTKIAFFFTDIVWYVLSYCAWVSLYADSGTHS